MSGRSTIDHICTFKQVIEKYYKFNLIFIDFKQAYDSVQKTIYKNIDDKSEHGRIKMSSQIWSREIKRIPNNNRIKTR